jgi:hypothetical protein
MPVSRLAPTELASVERLILHYHRLIKIDLFPPAACGGGHEEEEGRSVW